MDTINVLVHGAAGKVGQEIISTLGTEPGLRLVGAVDIKADQAYLELPGKAGKVPYATSLDSLLTSIKPDVIVDFTVSKAAMPAIRLAASRHVNLVLPRMKSARWTVWRKNIRWAWCWPLIMRSARCS
jgi:4-hydroxy-tetrahydrodipicolinate reductase